MSEYQTITQAFSAVRGDACIIQTVHGPDGKTIRAVRLVFDPALLTEEHADTSNVTNLNNLLSQKSAQLSSLQDEVRRLEFDLQDVTNRHNTLIEQNRAINAPVPIAGHRRSSKAQGHVAAQAKTTVVDNHNVVGYPPKEALIGVHFITRTGEYLGEIISDYVVGTPRDEVWVLGPENKFSRVKIRELDLSRSNRVNSGIARLPAREQAQNSHTGDVFKFGPLYEKHIPSVRNLVNSNTSQPVVISYMQSGNLTSDTVNRIGVDGLIQYAATHKLSFDQKETTLDKIRSIKTLTIWRE